MGIEVGSLNIDISMTLAKFRDGIRDAHKHIKDFSNAAKRMSKDLDKFSKSTEKLGKKLSKDVTAPILGMAAAFTAASLKAADYEAQMGNLAPKQEIDGLKKQINSLVVEIGQAFLPIVIEVIQVIQGSVIPVIRNVIGWFKGLSDETKRMIVIVAGIVAAIGPALLIFGKLTAVFSTVIGLVSKLSGVLALLVSPVGLIVAAVAAATALIIYNWDAIVDYFTNGDGVQWLGALKEIWDSTLDIISKTISVFVSIATAIWDKFGDRLIGEFRNAMNFLSDVTTNVLAGIADIFFTFSSLIKGNWSDVWDGIKSVLANSFQLIIRIISQGIDTVLSAVQTLASFVSDDFAAKLQNARNGVSKFKDGLVGWADQFRIVHDEGGGVLNFLDIFTGKAAKASQPIKDIVIETGKLWKQFGELTLVNFKLTESLGKVEAPMRSAALAISEGSENVKQSITDTNSLAQAWENLIGIWEEMRSGILADLFTSIAEGMGNVISGSQSAGDALKNLFLSVFKGLKAIGAQLIAIGTGLVFAQLTAAQGTKMIIGGGIVVAAATAAQGLLASGAFAQGGLVFGETLALVGEGSGTTRSNPEVIAPLDKLASFIQPQGMGGNVRFEIAGEKLIGVLQRTERGRKFAGRG